MKSISKLQISAAIGMHMGRNRISFGSTSKDIEMAAMWAEELHGTNTINHRVIIEFMAQAIIALKEQVYFF